MQTFDAVVVGGGPGGYGCAIRLAQNGLRVALAEEAELGGTCLNRGCIPTKTLLHSAGVYHQATHSGDLGVTAAGASFDYAQIIRHKDGVVRRLRQGIGFLERDHGVTVFRAHAVLTSRTTVSLDSGETLSCRYLILATGSRPARLPIPGADLPGVVDSTGLLDRTACPKHIVIVGGGVIGIEFATFYSRLGVRVTIVEMLDRVLGPLDKEITDFVEAGLKQNGVELALGVRVEAIEPGLKVRYASGKGRGTAEGDVVLLAGGRVPNTGGLGLEAIGVKTDRKGFVETDGLCRTSVPGIYAIGDVNGLMPLAHVAAAQGDLVARHIAGSPCKQLDRNRIPSCVYCEPEAAAVGLTEEQARALGRDAGSGVFPFSANGKALSMGQGQGFAKLVFDRGSGEILGFHAVGPRVTDLAAEVAAVMECEGTIAELGSAVHPHPAVSEVLMEAARACRGTCVNLPKAKAQLGISN